jgi:hypothetical protein
LAWKDCTDLKRKRAALTEMLSAFRSAQFTQYSTERYTATKVVNVWIVPLHTSATLLQTSGLQHPKRAQALLSMGLKSNGDYRRRCNQSAHRLRQKRNCTCWLARSSRDGSVDPRRSSLPRVDLGRSMDRRTRKSERVSPVI